MDKKAPHHLQVGRIGEEIAAKFLVKRGFEIVCRNYRKQIGEIDIVATRSGKIHFVEVKTVSRITAAGNDIRPEEHVHQAKLRRFGRTVEVYLEEFHEKREWSFHVITVILDQEAKTARVSMIADQILPE